MLRRSRITNHGSSRIHHGLVMSNTLPPNFEDRRIACLRWVMTHEIGVGSRLPDVTLPSLDGDDVHLAELRGKRRLLYLWGSW